MSPMRVAESVHTREQHNTWSDKGLENNWARPTRTGASAPSGARQRAKARLRLTETTQILHFVRFPKIYHLS